MSIISRLISTGTAAGSAIFPIGRGARLIRSGIRATNSTNPALIAKNITVEILKCCLPPEAKLALNCISAFSLIGSCFICPNAVTAGAALHLMNEVYDQC